MELKFRAWDNVEGKMIYLGEDSDYSFEVTSTGISCTKLGENPFDWETLNHLNYLQYTGLKDAGNIEIYEDDILFDAIADAFYIVTWDDSYAMFFLKNRKEDMPDYDFAEYDVAVCNNLYVAGNIHQNPELLK